MCHIYNFDIFYENINIFLTNDHRSIWNYRTLNSHISQSHFIIDILFKFSGFSILIDYYKRLKAEIVKVPKYAFSGVGLLYKHTLVITEPSACCVSDH